MRVFVNFYVNKREASSHIINNPQESRINIFLPTKQVSLAFLHTFAARNFTQLLLLFSVGTGIQHVSQN